MQQRTSSLAAISVLLFLATSAPLGSAAEPPTLTTPVQVLTLKGHHQNIRTIVFSSDGKTVVTGGHDGTARVWDATTGKELVKVDHGPTIGVTVAVNRDGSQIITTQEAAAKDAGTARIWDAKTGKLVLAIAADPHKVLHAAFSPDGTKVATAGTDGGVFKDGGRAAIWDAVSGKEFLVLKGHRGVVHSVEFSPDGTKLLTRDDLFNVRVWDTKTGEELLTFKPSPSIAYSAAFSPDGSQFVAGGPRDACVVDTKTGKVVQTFKGHTRRVHSVAFSPCGTRVLTGSDDLTARVWDVKSGKELALVAVGKDSNLLPVAMSADGTRIAAGTGGYIPDVGYRVAVTIWEIATPIKQP